MGDEGAGRRERMTEAPQELMQIVFQMVDRDGLELADQEDPGARMQPYYLIMDGGKLCRICIAVKAGNR